MAEGTNLKDLLNSGSTEELRSIRDSELQRYQTNKILLDILKSGASKKFDGSTRNLVKSLKILTIKDFIKLENGQPVLGLDNLKINLSYTEKKSIKNFIVGNVKEQFLPLLEYINDTKNKYPDILNLKEKQMEILALEQKRYDTMLNLIELRKKRVLMLKSILDIKLSPYLQNEMHQMCTEYKSIQQKISLLNNFIAQEFVSRSDYTEKAIKEIVRCIDAELGN